MINKARHLVIWLVFALLPASAGAVEGYYLGAQAGQALYTSTNAFIFGGDFGIRTNPLLDVTVRFQYSSLSSAVTSYHPTLSADFHFWEFDDFDFSFGLGPGFYFSEAAGVNRTDFGLNVGLNTDVVIDETVHVGIGWRWHAVIDSDNFWAITARLGFFFETDN